ncbi:golgin candidate 5-like [Papaver somniferum]|uniref:golgin candidate 5-like n=1 Tax=Papaver somniferum TaxID=3469 RepID=UPI000E6FCF5F|nr:golgin candidate 5-like [Papaver somniferum]
MAWLGKFSSGGFPDLAGAVNKLSESVKNIEKNFDSALGLEEKSSSESGGSAGAGEASGLWPSGYDRKALFEPMMAFMGQKGEEEEEEEGDEDKDDESEKAEPSGVSSEEELKRTNDVAESVSEQSVSVDKDDSNEASQNKEEREHIPVEESTPSEDVDQPDTDKPEADSEPKMVEKVDLSEDSHSQMEHLEVGTSEVPQLVESSPKVGDVEQVESSVVGGVPDETRSVTDVEEQKVNPESTAEEGSYVQVEEVDHQQSENVNAAPGSDSTNVISSESTSDSGQDPLPNVPDTDREHDMVAVSVPHEVVSNTDSIDVKGREVDLNTSIIEAHMQANVTEADNKDQRLSTVSNVSDLVDAALEIETLKTELKMMEAALLGAARQSQAKADEIARLMNDNEHLKALTEDLKRRSSEAETEALREEYHQRVATLERKVYALTRERDTLRREQNKKSDAAALLKEKDEIITQVMAEGEELSKKQAAQESTIRKLRAQIREFEEEKKGLVTKLQGEEHKVESIKKDKAVTEKYLQEIIEKHQSELAAQKEFYTNALNAAKEAEALAEARANREARSELESRLRESEERQSTLIQTLEELRQTLSRTEQQAAFKEDMFRKDIDDLQKRYQASERRCEELVTQVPESTRPLLRQIEAMQETTARRAEAWAGVERSLNSRLQEAEAKAAAAEENERAMNERLSQTISRMAVLEAQISCLRAEQTQLSRSLEKERQRASENRQEYLAAQESVATYEVRVNQLEEKIKEHKKKHRQELMDLMSDKELLQQELEREKTARSDLERKSRLQSSVPDQSPTNKNINTYLENGGNSMRKLSSAGSLGSMEESFFLQASLDSSDSFSEKRLSEATMTPYYLRSMTPSAFESTLRQKDGELASYMSRLASLESIRDSLAEELVKMTAEVEKLKSEAAILPGLRTELEALRRRHSAALELMGERDEELEELRADIMDVKEMYREQVNLLVNKIQILSSSVGAA